MSLDLKIKLAIGSNYNELSPEILDFGRKKHGFPNFDFINSAILIYKAIGGTRIYFIDAKQFTPSPFPLRGKPEFYGSICPLCPHAGTASV